MPFDSESRRIYFHSAISFTYDVTSRYVYFSFGGRTCNALLKYCLKKRNCFFSNQRRAVFFTPCFHWNPSRANKRIWGTPWPGRGRACWPRASVSHFPRVCCSFPGGCHLISTRCHDALGPACRGFTHSLSFSFVRAGRVDPSPTFSRKPWQYIPLIFFPADECGSNPYNSRSSLADLYPGMR